MPQHRRHARRLAKLAAAEAQRSQEKIAEAVKTEKTSQEGFASVFIGKSASPSIPPSRKGCKASGKTASRLFSGSLDEAYAKALRANPEGEFKYTEISHKEPDFSLNRFDYPEWFPEEHFCQNCGSTSLHRMTSKCSACYKSLSIAVRYCSPECQSEGWPEHKRVCASRREQRIQETVRNRLLERGYSEDDMEVISMYAVTRKCRQARERGISPAPALTQYSDTECGEA